MNSPSLLVRNYADTIAASVNETVLGSAEVAKLLFGAFLVGGHVLIEGPPGIAKTLLSKTFARVLGLEFRRIQFTPDLMPSDVTGVNVFDQKSGNFRFIAGPIFSDILLADEINRTPPKTQSALLEAMEERQVTIDGERKELSRVLFVIATQNPIEHEGTFPLPEAQLDRFFFKLNLSYPERSFEEKMIQSFSGTEGPSLLKQNEKSSSLGSSLVREFDQCQNAIRSITFSPAMSDYLMRILEATRRHPALLLGASPRAGLHLALATKLQAALEGRDYVIPDDLKLMAIPVLKHRLILSPEMYEAVSGTTEIISELLNRIPPPETIQNV